MGFFSNLLENARLAKYLIIYDTLPPAVKSFYEKKEFAADILEILDLQQTYEVKKWPPGWPFCSLDSTPWLAEHFEWAKSEGATDEDIIWWWNLAPIEKVIIQDVDAAYRRGAVLTFLDNGLNGEEAMNEIKLAYATYTEKTPDVLSMSPGDKEVFLSEDRMLPVELHNRVDIYVTNNNSDPSSLLAMKKEKDGFSSFNAWARYLIKNNRL